MRQKVELLSEDLSQSVAPTEAELQAFLAERVDDYRLDPRATFVHVYVSVDRRGATWFVTVGGDTWVCDDVVHRGNDDDIAGAHGDGIVRSPMPGTVIAVSVDQGATVTAGQTVAIVEAMKMEHALTAPIDGVVDTVHTAAGGQVALDQPIVTIAATVD